MHACFAGGKERIVQMISVIIPVYNTVNYIDRCVSSVLNQSEQNLEIILIDDCSSDGSKEKLKQWEEKDPRIKVIYKEENAGVSSARNDGILLSKGQYIAFVDSDDSIEENYFKDLLFHMEKTDADIAFGRLRRIFADHFKEVTPKRETGDVLRLYEAVEYCLPKMGQSWFDGFIWDKLFRRDVIFKNRSPVLFDSSVHFTEDCLWLMHVMMNMNKAVIVNEAVYQYDCIRPSSAHNAVYGSGNALLAKDAILVYERIGNLLKEKGLPLTDHALQRKLIYQKLACRGAAANGDVMMLKETGKEYVRNLCSWLWNEKSLYGLKWSVKQFGAYCLYRVKVLTIKRNSK